MTLHTEPIYGFHHGQDPRTFMGLMEGWNHRDGHPCPKCKGAAKIPVVTR